jgi:hypothetical protein
MDIIATTHTANVGSFSNHTAKYNRYFVEGAALGLSLYGLITVVVNLCLISWELLK